MFQPVYITIGEKPTTQSPTTEPPTKETPETTFDYDVTTKMTVTPAPFYFLIREITSSMVKIFLKSSDDVVRYVVKLGMRDDVTGERKEIEIVREKEEMLFQLTMLPGGLLFFNYSFILHLLKYLFIIKPLIQLLGIFITIY